MNIQATAVTSAGACSVLYSRLTVAIELGLEIMKPATSSLRRRQRGTQETLTLLKILGMGNQEVTAGKVKPVADVVARPYAKRG